jgi:FkbM family methyltransferase
LGFRIRRFAREHRKSRIVRCIARQCEKFLYGFYNESFFELAENGEARVIDAVAAAHGPAPLIVFDVGANHGEWAKAVLARRPDTVIYCFEIVPAIATLLRNAMANDPTVRVCGYGLSSVPGDIEVFSNPIDRISAITPLYGDPPGTGYTAVPARVETGDLLIRREGLPRLDLLKIDVEGHEIEVLSGFRDTLASPERRPRVIQFEYGSTWLPMRHTLREAYDMLRGAGYAIGRLYPEGVDFKPYSFPDDHFRMGNYIAVQAQDALMQRLARFG